MSAVLIRLADDTMQEISTLDVCVVKHVYRETVPCQSRYRSIVQGEEGVCRDGMRPLLRLRLGSNIRPEREGQISVPFVEHRVSE